MDQNARSSKCRENDKQIWGNIHAFLLHVSRIGKQKKWPKARNTKYSEGPLQLKPLKFVSSRVAIMQVNFLVINH